MAKINVSELNGIALNWAVASFYEKNISIGHNHTMTAPAIFDIDLINMQVDGGAELNYLLESIGLLMQSEKISATYDEDFHGTERDEDGGAWIAYKRDYYLSGANLLTAVLRCLVATKFGDFITIPDLLLELTTFYQVGLDSSKMDYET
ncbi:hypothetical protein [Methylomonas sp. AM2-LC]|uniref:hypothetical protein n=1 Tax=Methylomonas sp. AM2-LC TaxID=3153301 RepID=UPI0032654C09